MPKNAKRRVFDPHITVYFWSTLMHPLTDPANSAVPHTARAHPRSDPFLTPYSYMHALTQPCTTHTIHYCKSLTPLKELGRTHPTLCESLGKHAETHSYTFTKPFIYIIIV